MEIKAIHFPPPVSDDMVRAILEGRKTVTRLVVKLHANDEIFSGIKFLDSPYAVFSKGKSTGYEFVRFPYRTGQALYVRETWNYGFCDTTDFEFQVNETFFEELTPGTQKDSFLLPRYFYRTEDLDGIVGMKWRPSIHMPREAARIFLRVMDVRVESLQDMPHDGPLKEGIQWEDCPSGFTWKDNGEIYHCYTTPIGAMRALWDSTIKPADRSLYGWEANPYVWVISFERISKEEAQRCM